MSVALMFKANPSVFNHPLLHALSYMRRRAIQGPGISAGLGARIPRLRIIPYMPLTQRYNQSCPCCLIIEARLFLSDNSSPSSGLPSSSETYHYEPQLSHWQSAKLVIRLSFFLWKVPMNFSRRRWVIPMYPYACTTSQYYT